MRFDIKSMIDFPCTEHRPHGGMTGGREVPLMPRTESTSEFQPLEDREVEYFFASDASAVIEHTNRVIYLEVNIMSSLYYLVTIPKGRARGRLNFHQLKFNPLRKLLSPSFLIAIPLFSSFSFCSSRTTMWPPLRTAL